MKESPIKTASFVAFHETRHKLFKNTLGGDLGEVNAIIMQTTDKSWGKTSSKYKESQALYAQKSFNLAVKNGHVGMEQYDYYLNQLNKGFQGYWEFFILEDQMEIMPFF